MWVGVCLRRSYTPSLLSTPIPSTTACTRSLVAPQRTSFTHSHVLPRSCLTPALHPLTRRLVVAPVYLLLTSSNPDQVAEGRALALQAALGVRQCGLLSTLEAKLNSGRTGLSSVGAAFKAFIMVRQQLYCQCYHYGRLSCSAVKY